MQFKTYLEQSFLPKENVSVRRAVLQRSGSVPRCRLRSWRPETAPSRCPPFAVSPSQRPLAAAAARPGTARATEWFAVTVMSNQRFKRQVERKINGQTTLSCDGSLFNSSSAAMHAWMQSRQRRTKNNALHLRKWIFCFEAIEMMVAVVSNPIAASQSKIQDR